MSDAFTRNKLRWLDRVMHDAGLSATTRLVAYEIARNLNRVSNDAWPSQKTVAKNLGLHERTVKASVAVLSGRPTERTKEAPKATYIVVEFDQRTRSNSYRLNLKDGGNTPPSDGGNMPLSDGGNTPPQRGQIVHGDGGNTPPNLPLREPIDLSLEPYSSPPPPYAPGRKEGGREGQQDDRLRPRPDDGAWELRVIEQVDALRMCVSGMALLELLHQLDDGRPRLRLIDAARRGTLARADVHAALLAYRSHPLRRGVA